MFSTWLRSLTHSLAGSHSFIHNRTHKIRSQLNSVKQIGKIIIVIRKKKRKTF